MNTTTASARIASLSDGIASLNVTPRDAADYRFRFTVASPGARILADHLATLRANIWHEIAFA